MPEKTRQIIDLLEVIDVSPRVQGWYPHWLLPWLGTARRSFLRQRFPRSLLDIVCNQPISILKIGAYRFPCGDETGQTRRSNFHRRAMLDVPFTWSATFNRSSKAARLRGQ
jgi:hypothetical protein